MNSLKKIKELLKFTKKKTYKINMYAEAILDDARVIATDSDSFDIGAEVYVINDSGEVESLSEGIYTLQDGEKIRIDSESKVAGLGEEEVVEEEVVVEEDLAEEEVIEKEKVEEVISGDEVIEEVAVKINEATPEEVTEDISREVAKIVVDHLTTKVEEEVEVKEIEMSEEENKENEVQLSEDVMGEVLTRLSAIEEQLNKLEDEPSSEGVNVSPTHQYQSKAVNLASMSIDERVKYLMNN